MNPLAGSVIRAGLLILCLAAAGAAAAEWEVVHQDGEVQVAQRPYPDSPLLEFRGERRLTASLNAIMALLKDADYNHHWVYRSGGARVLEANGYAQAYVHGVVDAPWPMDDRDTVVRFDFRQHPASGVITIDITNFPAFIPTQPGLVRVPDFGGFWQLTPEANGEVAVIYQVGGDPGGWVPVWMANYAARISVARTLQNMPAAVARYRDVRAPEVREPGG